MFYIILISVLLGLMYFSYRIFNKDILSPSVIVTFMFLVSAISAYIGSFAGMWNIYDINIYVILIIIIGIMSFILGEILVRKVFLKNLKERKSEPKTIHIDKWKLIIVYVFVILTIGLIYFQMSQITGTTNISQMINEYRNQTPLFNKDFDTNEPQTISTIFIQMFRATELFGVVFIYIIINNILLKDALKNNAKYTGIIVISLLTGLLIGGRASMLKLIVAALFIYIILYRKTLNKQINLKKLILYGGIGAVVLLPLFYFLVPLLGRNNEANFINYMTFYLGSPIPSLSEILNRVDIQQTAFWGEQTFKGIQGILARFDIIGYSSMYQREWISFGENLSSNVYTCLKPFIYDFGVIGMCILQCISGIIVGGIYKIVLNKDRKIVLILFAFFSYYIVDLFRSEKIFGTLVGLDTIIYIIYAIIILTFLFENLKELKDRVYERARIIKENRGIKSRKH